MAELLGRSGRQILHAWGRNSWTAAFSSVLFLGLLHLTLHLHTMTPKLNSYSHNLCPSLSASTEEVIVVVVVVIVIVIVVPG